MAYYILKSYNLDFSVLKIFEALSRQRNCFFLDSSLHSGGRGRFSFLGAEPFFVLKIDKENPFRKIRKLLEQYKACPAGKDIPFFCGAVGYFSYDLGFALEKCIKTRNKPPTGIADCILGFYNTVIIIDHYKHLCHILCLGFPEKKYFLAKKLAKVNFQNTRSLLREIESRRHPNAAAGFQELPPAGLEANFRRASYLGAVKLAKEYIRRGDIYQVNLSQQFNIKTNLPAIQIYCRLRKFSPSSFGAYFDAGDFQIISSSPERFLKLEKGLVFTRPMKGTRPRAANPLLDRMHKRQLIESAKDRAELVMIVDLERNDLGKVCSYGSVCVPKLRELEKYRTVFQTTATVTGMLHRGRDRLDLLRACFPGGSITGCPKIRAMEIIEELEPSRRGIYTGCLGYLSFCGNMDFNLMIRTILKKGRQLNFGVGGGIVADSGPCSEYEETLVKARGIFQAINAL